MLDGDVARAGLSEEFPVAGMILLGTDLTTEQDAKLLVPETLRIGATRIAFDNPTTPDNLRLTLPRLGAAAELLLPGTGLSSIYFSCTAATATLGQAAIESAVNAARPGVRVITPASAAEAAFAALGAHTIAILTPYVPETAAEVESYFNRQGFNVVHSHAMGMEDDRLMARIDVPTILVAADRADHNEAEALFISCTALPAARLVNELEQRLGKPVVTSNLAGLWMMMRLAGLDEPIEGRGILMTLGMLEPVA